MRTFCGTILLIALLQLALPLGQLWAVYRLRKAEIDRDAHPRIEIPTFHAEPRLREPPSPGYGEPREKL